MLPRVNVVRGDNADYLLFSVSDTISNAIYLDGAWERHMTVISRRFYENAEAPLVLDIGANLGGYAVPVAKEIAAAGGVVYAYEPQRIVYYQLCGNLFLNRLDNVHAFHLALGEADGVLDLPAIDYAHSHNIGRFSVDRRLRRVLTGISVDDTRASDPVPIVRLDGIELPRSPCLLKIDVEGHELPVLEGGRAFLARHDYPPILLEAWRADWFRLQRAALLACLDDLGYACFSFGDEVIAQHPARGPGVAFYVDDAGVLCIGPASPGYTAASSVRV